VLSFVKAAFVLLVEVVEVVAFPDRAPVKVVVVRLFVLASYNKPVSVFRGWLPVAVLLKTILLVVVVLSAVKAALVLFVAVVALVAEVAVEALPVKAPTKVDAVKAFVDAL
jgi:hypothetical protein